MARVSPRSTSDETSLSATLVYDSLVDRFKQGKGYRKRTAAGITSLDSPITQGIADEVDDLSISDENTEQDFYALAEQWRSETAFVSISSEQANNFAYHQIIGMGKKALPFIFREIRETTSDWFWALRAITRTDVTIAPEDQGDVDKIAEAWLEWGIDHGYAHR